MELGCRVGFLSQVDGFAPCQGFYVLVSAYPLSSRSIIKRAAGVARARQQMRLVLSEEKRQRKKRRTVKECSYSGLIQAADIAGAVEYMKQAGRRSACERAQERMRLAPFRWAPSRRSRLRLSFDLFLGDVFLSDVFLRRAIEIPGKVVLQA